MNRLDENIWSWVGTYGISALMHVADQICSKHPKCKYIEEPISKMESKARTSGNTESNEECAVYEMKQRIKLLRQSGLPEGPD